MHLDFVAEQRNVRLRLLTDDFKSFGHFSNEYNTWPMVVMEIPYNLPSIDAWKKNQRSWVFLILMPKSPSDSIDVYMWLLTGGLIDLWKNGVWTYDKSIEKMFTMWTIVMWTIHDFPAYGMLSGWSIKRLYNIPYIGDYTLSFCHSWKICYLATEDGSSSTMTGIGSLKHLMGKQSFSLDEGNGPEMRYCPSWIVSDSGKRPRLVEQLNWTINSIFF